MKLILSTFILLAILPGTVRAQSITYSQPVGADTFVSSGATNVNFGSQGALELAAPTTAQPRTLLTLLRFDTAGLRASFDTDFGVGNWTVASVSLTLFSSVATAGTQPNNANFNKIAAGNFEFDLLNNDGWSETGITWNTLPEILPGLGNTNTLTPLGIFFWSAAGQGSSTWTLNNDSALLQKIYAGDLMSLLGQPVAGSPVSYLVNSRSLNPGFLSVTAAAVPEPATAALLTTCLCAVGAFRFYRR